jgi:HEAT repeat protein
MRVFGTFRLHRLLRNLRSPDPKVRMEAVDGLAETGDPKAIESLLMILEEKENVGILQARAIIALGRLRDRRATEPLLRILYGKVDTVPMTEISRLRAAEALGLIGDSRAVRPLLKWLKSHRDKEATMEQELFAHVREALIQIGRKEPGVLVDGMKDEDDQIRWEAVRALRGILDPSTVPAMVEALEDWNYAIRIAAAEVLGLIGDEQVVEPLTQSLKDVNRDVRSAARGALEQIRKKRSPRGSLHYIHKEEG